MMCCKATAPRLRLPLKALLLEFYGGLHRLRASAKCRRHSSLSPWLFILVKAEQPSILDPLSPALFLLSRFCQLYEFDDRLPVLIIFDRILLVHRRHLGRVLLRHKAREKSAGTRPRQQACATSQHCQEDTACEGHRSTTPHLPRQATASEESRKPRQVRSRAPAPTRTAPQQLGASPPHECAAAPRHRTSARPRTRQQPTMVKLHRTRAQARSARAHAAVRLFSQTAAKQGWRAPRFCSFLAGV